jgi:hypothetical protein
MTDFLNSLKADLLDRRLLPIVALVAVGLVAAVAYTALGGGSTASAPTPPATIARTSTGIAVSPSPASPAQAVAETTSGSPAQAHGRAHDPFNPLPADVKPAVSSTATATKTSSSTSSTSTSSKSGSSSKGEAKAETKPSTPSKPSAPSKSTTVYHVSVLFGVVPVPPPVTGVQLTPHDNLRLLTALPSAKQALIVFRGVTSGGKSATFTLVGEAILHGSATCLPSPSQCQEIELKAGQTEQLEFLPLSGPPVTYELRIVSIKSSKASSATVSRIVRSESKAGREVLRHAGLVAIPGLRYSSAVGVLTFAPHAVTLAHAHVALQQRRSG